MLKEMGDVMREAYSRNWITIRDGNCAYKDTSKKCIFMTPSGVRKNVIFPENLSITKRNSHHIKTKNIIGFRFTYFDDYKRDHNSRSKYLLVTMFRKQTCWFSR